MMCILIFIDYFAIDYIFVHMFVNSLILPLQLYLYQVIFV